MKTIEVTATFTVRFKQPITNKQYAALAAGDIPLDDIIDESIPYRLASSEGDCDMEWEYDEPRKRKP